MDSIQVDPKDGKYYKSDNNFNPNRNKALISETIKETEKFFADLHKLDDDESKKRVDIISSYGIYRFNKGTKDLKHFLGPKMYGDLLGEKLRDKVRAIESVNKLGSKKILL